MNRRTFTKVCIGATPMLLGASGFSFLEETSTLKKIPKTDTHVHLFDLEQFSYSWLKNAPEINRNFSLKDFKKAGKGSTVKSILFMESGADPEFGLKEAQWVANLAGTERRIKGIIARIDLTNGEESAKTLEEYQKIKLLKGFRGRLNNNIDQNTEFIEGLKRLGAQQYTYDFLLQPALMPTAFRIAQQCPDTTFIVDHFGNPDVAAQAMDSWKQGIQQLAELPNVHCKLSGIITRAGKNWTVAQLQPYFDWVLEQFGADRLVYGGDWPVVLRAGSYREWASAFEALTSELSETEQHQIYHENADRIYRLYS